MRLIFSLAFLVIFSLSSQNNLAAQKSYKNLGVTKAYILKKVNALRQKGCRCGRKYYKPVGALTWNDKLEKSAYVHAKEMDAYNYFSHKSIDGEDIGERLDEVGYKWQYAGENLAEGQDDFDEALNDWIESATHCKMLMNGDMTEMGMSRVGRYWVHHFGKLMPPRTRRTKVKYREGE